MLFEEYMLIRNISWVHGWTEVMVQMRGMVVIGLSIYGLFIVSLSQRYPAVET